MEKKVIKEHFWKTGVDGDVRLTTDDLGWPEMLKEEALSDYPETIFRHCIEIVGFNLLFYWTRDENFYTIETVKNPIEVRRIYNNPQWDGVCEFLKAGIGESGPNTSSAGYVIATFSNPTRLWTDLIIDGVPINQVLEESAILTWD
ncbi:MAG: hypothetical protein Q4D14_02950 [Bacteroidales bacterium]|nr:hypothetical protein [Bacteroidales bacterium]